MYLNGIDQALLPWTAHMATNEYGAGVGVARRLWRRQNRSAIEADPSWESMDPELSLFVQRWPGWGRITSDWEPGHRSFLTYIQRLSLPTYLLWMQPQLYRPAETTRRALQHVVSILSLPYRSCWQAGQRLPPRLLGMPPVRTS